MLDYAVVGSGIGGCCSALMLSQKNYDVVLFEKENNLGGCSSTFKRFGNFYNTGATTFAGYKKGQLVYEFFRQNGIDIDSKPLQSAVTIYQNGSFFKRYKDLESFIKAINKVHYHPKNKEFYTLIYDINEKFYAIKGYYYSNQTLFKKLFSLTSYFELFKTFYPYLFKDAKSYIKKFFGSISDEYLNYIDNQLLIVAQAKSEQVNFLTAALALGYQFQDNHYIIGGMESVFESMAEKINIKRKTQIKKIVAEDGYYTLYTKDTSYSAKNIILNTTIFDAPALFEDKKILNYFNRYKKLDSQKSAFMLYLELDTQKEFDHHYQLIAQKEFSFTCSNSIFVSFGDSQDQKMKKSVTISIHVNKKQWDRDHERKKEILEDEILEVLKESLDLDQNDIKRYFSAKPFTYKRFINRSTLGGIPMSKNNLVFNLPGNDTPIKGLYMVGDTTYAAQGWPGVIMGVKNLERLLCKS